VTKDRVIQPGYSKAVNFVIGSVNIVREPTILGSKSPEILIKNIEITWAQNDYWKG
jgi:hypothetical protein